MLPGQVKPNLLGTPLEQLLPKKRSRGRRPLPVEEKRRNPLTIYLTDAEYEKLNTIAAKSPLSLADILRQAMLKEFKKHRGIA